MSRQNTPSHDHSRDSSKDSAREVLEHKVRETPSTDQNDEHSVPNSDSSSLTNSPSPQHQRQVLNNLRAGNAASTHSQSSYLDSSKALPNHLAVTEVVRRAPGRPRNKLKRKAEPEPEFQKPSFRSRVPSQDRAVKVSRTEDSYRVNGTIKPIHPPSRKQPKRNARIAPSPSPPVALVQPHADRRKSHSRSLKSSLKTQEYHVSPKKNISLSPSPAPNMTNEKVIRRSEATEEQLKGLQKEALPQLRRIETIYTQFKNQIYKEKYAELTREVDAIQDGTSPLLIEKCQEAKSKYCQRIKLARKHRQYNLWEVKSQYAAEQYAIDSQYLNERAALREQQRGCILQEQWTNEEAKIMADSYLVKPLGEEDAANDLFKMRGNKEQISPPTSPEEISPSFMQPEPVAEDHVSRNAHLYLPHNQSHHSSTSQHVPWAMPDPCSPQGQNIVEVQALGTDILLLARTLYRVGDVVAVLDLSQASTFNGQVAGIGPNELAQGRYQLTHLPDLTSPTRQPTATESPHHTHPWN